MDRGGITQRDRERDTQETTTEQTPSHLTDVLQGVVEASVGRVRGVRQRTLIGICINLYERNHE